MIFAHFSPQLILPPNQQMKLTKKASSVKGNSAKSSSAKGSGAKANSAKVSWSMLLDKNLSTVTCIRN